MPMDLSHLTPEQHELIGRRSCEIEIEKHESYGWKLLLEDPPSAAFLDVEGKPILLPVEQKRIANIRLLRVIQAGEVLIVFLQDTTFEDDYPCMVFSQRMPDADWYLATMYRAAYARSFEPLLPKQAA